MTKLDKGLPESGSGINLKHFIYLDSSRLTSYSSQLSDGVTQLRRLTENTGNRTVENPFEKVRESFRENGSEGGFAAGIVTGKKINKRNSKTTFKESSPTIADEYSQSFSENKIDYDNAYLILEQQLMNKGLLSEISESTFTEYTPLIKTKGVSRFFDWESITKLLGDTLNLSNQNSIDDETSNQIKALRFIINAVDTFSLGPITFYSHVGQLGLLASLNPDHLRITRPQLRAVYVMPGDVEMTIVGFTPKRTLQPTAFPGVAGSMNMQELWQGLVGEVNLVIDPIAIYAENTDFT